MSEPRGVRFRGLNLAHPINRIMAGGVALAQNVRELLRGTFGMRPVLSAPALTLGGAVRTIQRLNDSTPAGPASGYSIIAADAAGGLWCNAVRVAVGLTGNPVSMIPFRPNASVQPWMYVFDSATDGAVTLTTKKAIDGTPTTFVCGGSVKVRSDGLAYKTGIKEPQLAPTVSTPGTTTTGTDALPATTYPWTNAGGVNAGYNYSHTLGTDGTAPVIIACPVYGSKVTLTVTGSATVNGITHTPGNAGPTGSTTPGAFITTPSIVVGAFTDGSGNVVSLPAIGPVNIGASVTLTVPNGAVQLQVGINSASGTFNSNSGAFSIAYSVMVSAIATKVSTLGNITAYYWGDSPHGGGNSLYLWKNPNDTGTGIPRTIGTAAGSATNNSWQFDLTPGSDTTAVQWNTLASDGSVSGSLDLFNPALESEGFSDFNVCVVGALFIPAGGTYTFTMVNHNQAMLGIGGGATVTGGFVTGATGQTTTVVSSLPLMLVSAANGDGAITTNTISVTFPGTGTYQVEIDWDWWHQGTGQGRTLVLTCNSATIPPLSQGVRTNVSYAYKYRASETGAQSNPSPTSAVQLTPVLDNTVGSVFSPDPQVDKVDYYRQDSGLTTPTYVATGPNDGLGGTVAGIVYNTPIVDSLSDLDAATNPDMNLDDFEPVPSIDLPRSGVVNVSGGVISWVSGDTFNLRWLAGTVMEIGSPTQIAYSLIARPTTTTSVTIPGVPDGTNLVYNIAEPILAAQPLPNAFGPTDNINFAYAVKDPLRPGTFYWSKGSNLDSWPDTNSQDITDPGEPIVNGAMSSGIGAIGTIRRVFVILPNFFNALATVTGTSGSTWTTQATSIDRGLYMPRCIAVQGGGALFFRVKDGIEVSRGGQGSKSITDEELYPLFPHENSTPQAVVRAGVTIYPPNDALPQLQQFSVVAQFLYWNYQGTDGNPHTLVFDTEAGGWIWDVYTPAATCHANNDGTSQQGVLVGGIDSTVRTLGQSGSETPTAIVQVAAIGGKGFNHASGFTVEYASKAPITLSWNVADVGNGSYAPNPVTLPATGGALAKFRSWVSPNKWKLLQSTFTFTDPTAQINIVGFVVDCRDWGSTTKYRQVSPFSDDGGFGSQT